MGVQIEHIPHKVYSNTFLHRVILKINYQADLDVKYDHFKTFFRKVYNLELDEEKYNLLKYSSLRLSGEDDAIILKFSKGFIQLKIEKQAYESFHESLVPFIKDIHILLKMIDAHLTRISIQKINMWAWEANNADEPLIAMKQILNPVLTDNWPSDGEGKSTSISTTMTPTETPELKVVLAFGYVGKENENSYSRIVLDTEGLCEDMLKLENTDMVDLAEQINDNLFDVYHWAVKKEIIDKMN